MLKSKDPFHLRVLAVAGAPREEVRKESADRLHIYVREPAEGNRANKRILELVRELHPGRRVSMVNGHRSPHKTFLISSFHIL